MSRHSWTSGGTTAEASIYIQIIRRANRVWYMNDFLFLSLPELQDGKYININWSLYAIHILQVKQIEAH